MHMSKKTTNAPVADYSAVEAKFQISVNHNEVYGQTLRSVMIKQERITPNTISDLGKTEFGTTNIFTQGSMTFENKKTLVLFMSVPKTKQDYTDEQLIIEAKDFLKNNPRLNLCEVRSLNPILGKEDEYAIKKGYTTLEDIADKQILKNPETDEPHMYKLSDGQEVKQYRKIVLHTKDTDRRVEDSTSLLSNLDEVPF